MKSQTCPYCKKEIGYLNAYSEIVQTFELDDNREGEVNGMDYCDGFERFECPECGELIASNERDAIIFLKGEKIK